MAVFENGLNLVKSADIFKRIPLQHYYVRPFTPLERPHILLTHNLRPVTRRGDDGLFGRNPVRDQPLELIAKKPVHRVGAERETQTRRFDAFEGAFNGLPYLLHF